MADLVSARLRAQKLTGPGFESAVEAVRWFGAMQSQDYPAAKWALGLRVKAATEPDVDRAYDEGALLRTHVLRPTWHFVAPEDIRWMLELTGPKIVQAIAGRYRNLGLDARTVVRAQDLFANALASSNFMTRPELGAELSRAGISPEGQRLPHLLISGEFAGLLTSGPRKGKQLTYALLEERAPKARRLERDEAIAELTRRYFVSHGPAQVRDFVWWSGLTQAEVRRGLDISSGVLANREIDGIRYWFDPRLSWSPARSHLAHLVPNFDEYTVGYADRSAMLHPARPFRPELFSFSSVLANVVVIDGHVSGSWRRVAAPNRLGVELRVLTELSAPERRLVEQAGRRFSRFLGRPVELAWLPA